MKQKLFLSPIVAPRQIFWHLPKEMYFTAGLLVAASLLPFLLIFSATVAILTTVRYLFVGLLTSLQSLSIRVETYTQRLFPVLNGKKEKANGHSLRGHVYG